MIVLGGLEFLYYSVVGLVGSIALLSTGAFLEAIEPEPEPYDGYITEDDIRTEVYSSDED